MQYEQLKLDNKEVVIIPFKHITYLETCEGKYLVHLDQDMQDMSGVRYYNVTRETYKRIAHRLLWEGR